jgi:hypothetical protein
VARVHGGTLRQAHAQQRAVEEIAGVSVEPLLVFSRAWVDRPLARRKGVRVLPARMLVGHLNKRSATLSRGEIEQVRDRLAAALRDHEERARRTRGRGIPIAQSDDAALRRRRGARL